MARNRSQVLASARGARTADAARKSPSVGETVANHDAKIQDVFNGEHKGNIRDPERTDLHLKLCLEDRPQVLRNIVLVIRLDCGKSLCSQRLLADIDSHEEGRAVRCGRIRAVRQDPANAGFWVVTGLLAVDEGHAHAHVEHQRTVIESGIVDNKGLEWFRLRERIRSNNIRRHARSHCGGG